MANTRAVGMNLFILVALVLLQFSICKSDFEHVHRWELDRSTVSYSTGTAEEANTDPRQTTDEYAQGTTVTDIDESANTRETTTAKPTTEEHSTSNTTVASSSTTGTTVSNTTVTAEEANTDPRQTTDEYAQGTTDFKTDSDTTLTILTNTATTTEQSKTTPSYFTSTVTYRPRYTGHSKTKLKKKATSGMKSYTESAKNTSARFESPQTITMTPVETTFLTTNFDSNTTPTTISSTATTAEPSKTTPVTYRPRYTGHSKTRPRKRVTSTVESTNESTTGTSKSPRATTARPTTFKSPSTMSDTTTTTTTAATTTTHPNTIHDFYKQSRIPRTTTTTETSIATDHPKTTGDFDQYFETSPTTTTSTATTMKYPETTPDFYEQSRIPSTTTTSETSIATDHPKTTRDFDQYLETSLTPTTSSATTMKYPETTPGIAIHEPHHSGHSVISPSTQAPSTIKSYTESATLDCEHSDLLEAVVLDLSMKLPKHSPMLKARSSNKKLMSVYSPLCHKFMLIGKTVALHWIKRVLGCKQSRSDTAQTVLSIFITAESLRTEKDNCKPKLLKFFETTLVQYLLKIFRPIDGLIRISFKPNKSMVKPIAFRGILRRSGRRPVYHRDSGWIASPRQMINAILLNRFNASRDRYPILSAEVDLTRGLILFAEVHLMLDVTNSWNANEEPVNTNDYLDVVDANSNTGTESLKFMQLTEKSFELPTILRTPLPLCAPRNSEMNRGTSPTTSKSNTIVCHYTTTETSNQITMFCYSNTNKGMNTVRDTINKRLKTEETMERTTDVQAAPSAEHMYYKRDRLNERFKNVEAVERTTEAKPVANDDRWPYKIEEMRDVIRRTYYYVPDDKSPSPVENTNEHRLVTEYQIDKPHKSHQTIPRPPRPAHSGRIKKRTQNNLNPRMDGPGDRHSRI